MTKKETSDLLYCIYKFDDKPHLLFSKLTAIARKYEKESKIKKECVRLMNGAYNSQLAQRLGHSLDKLAKRDSKVFDFRCMKCGAVNRYEIEK